MFKNAIYDSLLIAAYADTIIETAEVRSIFDSIASLRSESSRLKKILAPDIEEEIRQAFTRVIPAVRDAGSPVAVMSELGSALSRLPKKDKNRLAQAVAGLIRSDNDIHFREREVYVAFKNALRLEQGGPSFLRRLFRGMEKRCKCCNGANIENTCVFELDGWTGMTGISYAAGGTGRGKPSGGGIMHKNCYYWRCNECGAEWEEIRKEFRRAGKAG